MTKCLVITAMLALPLAASAEPAKTDTTTQLAVASSRIAVPTESSKITNVEATNQRSTFQPTVAATRTRGGVGHPHRATLVSFEGQLRGGSTSAGQVDELAKTWKTNLTWDAITIDSYAAGKSEADNTKAAQRNADDVRAYLVKHGVPADHVIAIGHSGDKGAKVDLSVTTCDDVTIACRKPAAAPAPAPTK
jgi:hypothetical protein